MDGAGQENSARHNHPAATSLGAGSDGFGDCLGTVLFSIARGAEAGDVEIAIGEDRGLDARENRIRVPLGQRCGHGRSNGTRQQKGPAAYFRGRHLSLKVAHWIPSAFTWRTTLGITRQVTTTTWRTHSCV